MALGLNSTSRSFTFPALVRVVSKRSAGVGFLGPSLPFSFPLPLPTPLFGGGGGVGTRCGVGSGSLSSSLAAPPFDFRGPQLNGKPLPHAACHIQGRPRGGGASSDPDCKPSSEDMSEPESEELEPFSESLGSDASAFRISSSGTAQH